MLGDSTEPIFRHMDLESVVHCGDILCVWDDILSVGHVHIIESLTPSSQETVENVQAELGATGYCDWKSDGRLYTAELLHCTGKKGTHSEASHLAVHSETGEIRIVASTERTERTGGCEGRTKYEINDQTCTILQTPVPLRDLLRRHPQVVQIISSELRRTSKAYCYGSCRNAAVNGIFAKVTFTEPPGPSELEALHANHLNYPICTSIPVLFIQKFILAVAGSSSADFIKSYMGINAFVRPKVMEATLINQGWTRVEQVPVIQKGKEASETALREMVYLLKTRDPVLQSYAASRLLKLDFNGVVADAFIKEVLECARMLPTDARCKVDLMRLVYQTASDIMISEHLKVPAEAAAKSKSNSKSKKRKRSMLSEIEKTEVALKAMKRISLEETDVSGDEDP